jgi:nicotinamide riboside transporter PnuC
MNGFSAIVIVDSTIDVFRKTGVHLSRKGSALKDVYVEHEKRGVYLKYWNILRNLLADSWSAILSLVATIWGATCRLSRKNGVPFVARRAKVLIWFSPSSHKASKDILRNLLADAWSAILSLVATIWGATCRLSRKNGVPFVARRAKVLIWFSPSSHKASKDILRNLLADSWSAILSLVAKEWRATYRLSRQYGVPFVARRAKVLIWFSPSSHKASKDILRNLLADAWSAILSLVATIWGATCRLSRKNGVPFVARRAKVLIWFSPSSHKASKDILRNLLADSWSAILSLVATIWGATCRLSRKNGVPFVARRAKNGGPDRTRTYDQACIRRPLYQLSYRPMT